MRLGRRPLSFLAVAIISLLLLVPTPTEFRWVNILMTVLALFWFVLLTIEESQARRPVTDEVLDPSATATAIEREERP